MNLRNWNQQHTFGLLLGIATTLVAIPITLLIYSWFNDYSFDQVWYKFTVLRNERSKFLGLASIANLFWFHTFIRKENWNRAMGIILATFISLALIIYFKYLA